MAIERSANAVWNGTLKGGNGKMTAPSGVLSDAAYTYGTRFESAPGTNPEELIAAAHAACFSMAFSSALEKKGFPPTSIKTKATVIMDKREAGNSVVRVRLETEGQVPNIDEATFQQAAEESKKGCPISRLLSPGLEGIDLTAKLVK
jgi:osmotically inducible protein OsmC